MNFLMFFINLLTVIFGTITVAVSFIVLGSLTALKSFGIWFFLLIALVLVSFYFIKEASQELFDFFIQKTK
jgi:hypothetical protein